MSDDSTRAFICIDFSDEVIKEVARINELVENNPFIGKFTDLENLHLTLKFLGEISADKLEKVRERLRTIEMKEFEATLGEIGIFFTGKMRKPKIVWIKINGKEIWSLQVIIDEKLKDIFPKEEKFNTHMTIARVNYVTDKKYFENYLKNLKVKNIKFKIDCFKLKSSELRPNGPVYRDIEIFNLK